MDMWEEQLKFARSNRRFDPSAVSRLQVGGPDAARPRRQGYRIRLAMSAIGTKRTCAGALQMSAFRGKADIDQPLLI
jgi:hypothetical protein